MDDLCVLPSSSNSVIVSKELPIVPSTFPSLSAVDPDQSILYPTSITQPEELLAISKEVFESYDRHLSTAIITRQIHEKLIAELDTSVTLKEVEVARLKSCLQVAEAKLFQSTLDSNVHDLKVKLEIEESNRLQAEEAYAEEKKARLALEIKLEGLQEEEDFRKDQAIRQIQREGHLQERSQVDMLNAVIQDLEKRLSNSDSITQQLHIQMEEKERTFDMLEKKLIDSKSKEQLSNLQSMPDSILLPTPGPVGSTTVASDVLGLQTVTIALAASRREVVQLSSDLQALTSMAQADRDALQETRSELENQWKRADEHYDDIQRIKTHRDQLIKSLARSDAEIADLEGRVAQVESERYALELEVKSSENEREEGSELKGAKSALEARTTQLEDTTKRANELSISFQATLQEIGELNSQLSLGTEQFNQLRVVHEELLDSRDQCLSKSQEYQSQNLAYQDRVNLLTTDLTTTKLTILSLQRQIQDIQDSASRAIHHAEDAYEALREDSERRINSLNRDLAEQTEALKSLMKTQTEERQKHEEIAREKAAADLEAQLLNLRSEASSVELQRLNKLVVQLKNDDSTKEVKIMQLLKSKGELQETMETLEIALDSKQQELELVKRKFGVRGVAGSVSAPERTKMTSSRRRSIDSSTLEDSSTKASVTKASPTHFNILTPILTSRTSRPRSSLAMGTPGLRRMSTSALSAAPPASSVSIASSDFASTYPKSLSGRSISTVSVSSTLLRRETSRQISGGSEGIPSLMDLPSVPQDRFGDRSRKSRMSQSKSTFLGGLRSMDDKENFLEF